MGPAGDDEGSEGADWGALVRAAAALQLTGRVAADRGDGESAAPPAPPRPAEAPLWRTGSLPPAAAARRHASREESDDDTATNSPKSEPGTVAGLRKRHPLLDLLGTETLPAGFGLHWTQWARDLSDLSDGALFEPPPYPLAEVGPVPAADLLFPAISCFFSRFHPLIPVVHQPTFQRAFRVGHPVYGGRRPLALVYAAAAVGTIYLHDIPEPDRFAYARFCTNRARDLLIAQGAPDLEAAQASALILEALFVAGVPGRMLPLLRRCAILCDELYASLPPVFPDDADSWVRREMVCRLRALVAAFDLGAAYHAKRPTFGHYFHRNVYPLPCHDSIFDDPDVASAYLVQRSRVDADGEPSVPFGASDWPGIAGTVRTLAAGIAGTGCSHLSAFLLAHYLRHVRIAVARGMEGGLHLSAKQQHAVAQYAAAADGAMAALPPEIGIPLAAGDPGALLALSHRYFPSRAHALAALQLVLFGFTHPIEVLRDGGFRSAAAARCLRHARLLAGLVPRTRRWNGGTTS
ncbi:hypothetical protein DFJ74DRAFT_693017 [Hyaloraphidium curvatum]|nr:hypothetical protein DFJ74DRAFT_693017 [Hyaloraphidium curvatum]